MRRESRTWKVLGALVLVPALALVVYANCVGCKPALAIGESTTLIPGECLKVPAGPSCYERDGNSECYNNGPGEQDDCIENPTGGNLEYERVS